METAFTGVLLESALKLSNVTDANIFILVETSEGRQWAGNRRLKVRLCQLGFLFSIVALMWLQKQKKRISY